MELRMHIVSALKVGGGPGDYVTLFMGNDGDRHRQIFDEESRNGQWETVAIYENVPPRMVVHPAAQLAALKWNAPEAKAPAPEPEKKMPKPEAHQEPPEISEPKKSRGWGRH